jgi:hypothetical protein
MFKVNTFSYVVQFSRGGSVDSQQRMLLSVTKSHTGHLHSDQRSGTGGEEEVRLLADHHTPLLALRYVTTIICSAEDCILNRIILPVLDFILLLVVVV